MTKKVPLVIYENGERRIIGEAEVDEQDGNALVSAIVTDEEMKHKLSGEPRAFSFEERRNVFEQQKEN